MTSKKVLTGFGIFAALAIALISVKGFPPTKDGMEGAIGVAKRTSAEQITSDDVVLQDPEIQELLQSDVFLEMIQDEAFQKMVADGSLDRAIKVSRDGLGARLDVATIDGFGKISKLMQDDEGFRKAVEVGDLGKAEQIASAKGIKGDFDKAVKVARGDGLGARLDPAMIDGLGKISKLMQDDEGFRKAVEVGDLGKAEKIAGAKGIKGDFDKAVKVSRDGLGARLDVATIDGFGKISKLMQDDDGFRKAIEVGDLGKAQQIANTRGMTKDFGRVVQVAEGGMGARLDVATIDGFGKISKLMQDDEGFRKAVEVGDLGKAEQIAGAKGIKGDFDKAVKVARGDGLGARLDPAMIDGFGKISKLMQDDEGFRKAVEVGDLGKAEKIAGAKGIKGDFDKAVKVARGDGLGARLDPAMIDGFGKISKLMQDDEGFRKAVEVGDLGKAEKIAGAKGIKGDFDKAVKVARGNGLGARLDPAMIDGFGKVSNLKGLDDLVNNDGFRKLFVESPGFRQAMKDGAPGKFLKSAGADGL